MAIAGCILVTLQLFSLLFFPTSIFSGFRLDSLQNLSHSFTQPTNELRLQHATQLLATSSYNPLTGVAFGIPVGGRTERSANLGRILTNLLQHTPPKQIRIFEDVHSRPDKKGSDKIRELIERMNKQYQQQHPTSPLSEIGEIQIIPTNIPREKPEDQTNFGIHLARHYKAMLDYMFIGEINDGSSLSTSPGNGPPYDHVVVIEDDLVLAEDFVKYFHEMSRLMHIDETLYCVAAHQDNAFLATSYEEFSSPSYSSSSIAASEKRAVDPLQFAFRRGNHFMAPGWMTSRRIYLNHIRDRWLDSQGEYKYSQELHLRNGHWDRFFDSLIRERDCIFPEVPRIIHEGADGFTVSKKGQMELYSNLRLSRLPVDVDYGNLARLTVEGYRKDINEFISQATVLNVLEELNAHRSSKFVYVVPAQSDKDNEWNAVFNGFFGLIGVGGYGGWEGYVKVRGIWSGVVWVRYLNNLVLLVGTYSDFVWRVYERHSELTLAMTEAEVENKKVQVEYNGCIPPSKQMFTHVLAHYTRASTTPQSCLSSCLLLGYDAAAITGGGRECKCGNGSGAGTILPDFRTALVPDSHCDDTCLGSASTSLVKSVVKKSMNLILGSQTKCGGNYGYASVYTLKRQDSGTYWHDRARIVRNNPPPTIENVSFVAALPGESCTTACQRSGKGECEEYLFPIMHRSCPILSHIMACTSCEEESDIERGFSTPGKSLSTLGVCSLSKGKYISCATKPSNDFVRACACEAKPLSTTGLEPVPL